MRARATHSFIDGFVAQHDGDTEFDFITPAFIDIHCHGGGGKNFSEDPYIARETHRKSGTAVQMASLATAEKTMLINQIERIKNAPDIYGIHLEGPYLSHAYCGAHKSALLRAPEITEIDEFIRVAEGQIKMITFAPELENAIAAIEYVVNRGIIAAIGHSDARAADTRAAIKAGATVVTHINNGMAKIGSTDSLFSESINSDLYLELIEDGVHISDSDAKSIISQAPNRIVAITDAMAAAGAGEGRYMFGDQEVEVTDGKATLKSNGKLAGSTLTMLDSFLNFVKLVGFEKACQYTSTNPAAALGISVPQRYIGIKGCEVTYL